MVKKKFNLRREYKNCFDYIQESKNFIFLAIGIFFLFSLIGFFVAPPEQIRAEILKFISGILQKTEGMSSFELIRFIFLNNLQGSFLGIVLGIFFGVFPFFSAVFNGYLVGFVSSYSVQERGYFSLFALFPHGIFELPAIFISFGLGIKLSSFLFQKNKLKSFRLLLTNSIKVFVLIVVPLLIIAAIIEGFFISIFS